MTQQNLKALYLVIVGHLCLFMKYSKTLGLNIVSAKMDSQEGQGGLETAETKCSGIPSLPFPLLLSVGGRGSFHLRDVVEMSKTKV